MRRMFFNITLVCAGILLVGTAAEGKELIKNQTFKGDKREPWRVTMHGGVFEKNVHVEEGVLSVKVPTSGPGYYAMLVQPVKVKEGKSYRISFEVKAEGKDLPTSPMGVGVGTSKQPMKSYGFKKRVVLETDWKKHEYTFTATEIDKDNEPCIRFTYGAVWGKVFFRNISLIDESKGGLRRGGLPPKGLLPGKTAPASERKW